MLWPFPSPERAVAASLRHPRKRPPVHEGGDNVGTSGARLRETLCTSCARRNLSENFPETPCAPWRNRHRTTPPQSETAGQPEATPDGGELGDQPTERPGEERRGIRTARRRPTSGQPGTAAQRETAAATGTGEAGARGDPGRRSGRPRRRCTGRSHLGSTERDHQVRGGRPPTAAQRETAAATGPGREFGARRRRTSGHRGNPTAAQRETAVPTGPADATAAADTTSGPSRGDLAAARGAGDRVTRRGATDVRQHRRSTSRSGQPGRRPTGCATRGPSISYIEGPRTVCAADALPTTSVPTGCPGSGQRHTPGWHPSRRGSPRERPAPPVRGLITSGRLAGAPQRT